MLPGLFLLSSTSDSFILLATLTVILSTTIVFLGIGYGISVMFRRGTTSRSSTNSSTSGTNMPAAPIRKPTWGFSSPSTNAAGRVKAAAKEINNAGSPPQPARKNSMGLPSIRGGGTRPQTPSSTKSSSKSEPSKHPVSTEPPQSDSLKEMEEKVAQLTSEISLIKAQVEERDGKLAESRLLADRVKEELARANQELETVRARSEQLAGERDEQDRQLLTLQVSHENLRAQFATTSSSLQSVTSELEENKKKSEPFSLLPTHDEASSDDMVEYLQTLNANIEETASFMAEQFDLTSNSAKSAADFTSEDMEEAKERAEEILGTRMVQHLIQASKTRKGDLPALVTRAFQAGMSAYAEWMVSSWLFEDPGKEGVLTSIYESMRKTETGQVLGQWKSLTHKHGHTASSVTPSDLSIYFLDAMINVLIVAGFHATHMSLHSHITGNYSANIANLVRDATRLNRSLGQAIVTYDLEVVHIPPDASFDAMHMDIHPSNGSGGKTLLNKISGKKSTERVLCTLDLGLLRLVKNPTTGQWENRVLVKPRVLLLP